MGAVAFAISPDGLYVIVIASPACGLRGENLKLVCPKKLMVKKITLWREISLNT